MPLPTYVHNILPIVGQLVSNLIRFLLLFTIFFIPLIGPIKNLGYEQVKVFFFIVICSLICLIWIFRKPDLQWTNITKAASVFILILLISSFLGLDPLISFLGNQPYFQGVVFYTYLFLFFLIVKTSNIKFETWAKVLVWSGIFVSLLSIKDWLYLNFFNITIPTYAGRVVSSFGQPNFYSGLILLTLPFAYFLLKKQLKWWVVLGFLISAVGIIISQSRIAQFLLAGLLIWWLIGDWVRAKLLIVGEVALFLSLVVISSIFLGSGIFWQEIISPNLTSNPDLTKSSVESRVYIWPQAWQVILQRPLFGYGLENIDKSFIAYFENNKHSLFEENLNINPVLISLKELSINRTHNYLLDLLIFSGVLGLIAWIFLVVVIIRKLGQKSHDRGKNVLLVSLILYLVWIQFQNQSVVHLIYFWLLAGVIDKGNK